MSDPIVPPALPDGLPQRADPSRFDAVLARARRRQRRGLTAAVAALGTVVAVLALDTGGHPASLDVQPAGPVPTRSVTPTTTSVPTTGSPTPTVSPTPEPTVEPPPTTTPTPTPGPTEEPGRASPTARPTPTASEYGPHRAWRRYVAGAAPATCVSNQVREGADPADPPDNDWCMVYLGPRALRIGDEFTMVIRICRSGADGVAPKEMVSQLVGAVRHEPRQTTWLQHVLPEDQPIEVQPGDCLEWTITGWEERIPLEPGTYVVDASNHAWEACRYCYYYDPAAKWEVTVTD